jgi:hypothetical protein
MDRPHQVTGQRPQFVHGRVHEPDHLIGGGTAQSMGIQFPPCFNHASVVSGDYWIKDLCFHLPQASDRTFLVGCREAGISDNVGNHDAVSFRSDGAAAMAFASDTDAEPAIRPSVPLARSSTSP